MKTFACLTLLMVSAAVAQSSSNIDTLVRETDSEVIAWRRHIHANPELGYQETKTSAYIVSVLKGIPGMEVQVGIAKTGVKAVLRGAAPGPVVALRADMDALPVVERNDLPFRSQVVGMLDGKQVPVMHACGHDTHVAMLLGAASVLGKMRDQIKGTVVFLFQPAEEGGGGAFEMMKAGVLDDPKVDVIFGQHIDAGFPSGSLAYRSGGAMASADTFFVEVTGKGGHGSAPWATRDPVLASAQMIVSLQSAIARDADMTLGGSSLTIGQIDGGTRKNIIPEKVTFSGTTRTLAPTNRDVLEESLKRIVKSTADVHGVAAKVSYERLYPVTNNDPALTAKTVGSLRKAAGSAGVSEMPAIMASEDFGAYTRNIPGFFWFLHASPIGDKVGAPNHSPEFLIDERALKVGVAALVNAAVDYANGRMSGN